MRIVIVPTSWVEVMVKGKCANIQRPQSSAQRRVSAIGVFVAILF